MVIRRTAIAEIVREVFWTTLINNLKGGFSDLALQFLFDNLSMAFVGSTITQSGITLFKLYISIFTHIPTCVICDFR